MNSQARLWNFVSALGHPLVTVGAFLLVLALLQGPAILTLRHAFAIIAVTVIPLAAWTLCQTRSGKYSNFDVSVRKQRTSMYGVLLILLTPAAIAMQWAAVARPFRIGMDCITVMFAVAWLLNRWIKLSLHTAVSFFVAGTVFLIDARAASVLCGWAALVAISRLKLGRHSSVELWTGAIIGAAAAGVLLRMV